MTAASSGTGKDDQDRRILEAGSGSGCHLTLLRSTWAAETHRGGSLYWLPLLFRQSTASVTPHPGTEGSRLLARANPRGAGGRLNTGEMRGMLRLRHAQISEQLSEMQSQLGEVEARLHQIEREEQLSTYDVILKQVEPLLVALVRTILPSHNAVGALFSECYEALGSRAREALGPNHVQDGQTLVLWYDNEFKERDVDGAAAFMLRCRVPDSGRMQVQELPAATMAATIHHGSYNTIGEVHEAVLKWIETNGYRIVGPDREIYLYNTQPISRDDESYVTEIQYPAEKAT